MRWCVILWTLYAYLSGVNILWQWSLTVGLIFSFNVDSCDIFLLAVLCADFPRYPFSYIYAWCMEGENILWSLVLLMSIPECDICFIGVASIIPIEELILVILWPSTMLIYKSPVLIQNLTATIIYPFDTNRGIIFFDMGNSYKCVIVYRFLFHDVSCPICDASH